MPDRLPDSTPPAPQMDKALRRWENEGGSRTGPFETNPAAEAADAQVPPLTNAELVQLQIRTIALENLLIALLAEASDRQLELASRLAACISPRPGATQHRLTIHAAARMSQLVERSSLFRVVPPE